MKRIGIVFLLFAIALLAAPRPAQAQNYPFEASLLQVNSTTFTGGVYYRTWAPTAPGVNTNCDSNCATKPCTETHDGDKLCKTVWAGKGATGYRGVLDNIANYPPAVYGDVFHAVYDAQLGAGTPGHVGYYAWVSGPVNNLATDFWADLNCVGTAGAACVGASNSSNASDHGGITKVGGMSPIPPPKPTDIDADGAAYSVGGVKGTFQLRWDAVSSVGANVVPASYDLWYSKTPGDCPTGPQGPVETGYTFLSTVTTAQAEIPFTAVGMASATEPNCVCWALRLRYPGTTLGAKTSRYLSANGGCFGTAQAVSLYDLRARMVKARGPKTNIDVSWKVSNESGVDHYNVYRAYQATGPWTQVGTVPSGRPNYNFIDQTGQAVGMALHSFYQVGSVDIENKETRTAAVKVTR